MRPRWHRWTTGIGLLAMAAGLVLMPIAGLYVMGDPSYDPKTGRASVPDPPPWLVFGPFLLVATGVALLLLGPVHRLAARARPRPHRRRP